MSKADSTQTPLSEEALQKHKSNRSPGHFRGYVILTTQRRFLIVVADPITIEEPDSPDLESKFLSSASTAPSIETDVPNRECCSNSKGIDTNSVLTNSIPHHELVSPARKPNLASHSRSPSEGSDEGRQRPDLRPSTPNNSMRTAMEERNKFQQYSLRSLFEANNLSLGDHKSLLDTFRRNMDRLDTWFRNAEFQAVRMMRNHLPPQQRKSIITSAFHTVDASEVENGDNDGKTTLTINKSSLRTS